MESQKTIYSQNNLKECEHSWMCHNTWPQIELQSYRDSLVFFPYELSQHIYRNLACSFWTLYFIEFYV